MLPFIEYSNSAESVLVIKTANQKYTLVRVKPFNKVDTDGTPAQEYVVLGGVSLHWYIQSNGSLDFSSISQSGINSDRNGQPAMKLKRSEYHLALSQILSHIAGIEAYSLKGERINSEFLSRIDRAVIYRYAPHSAYK